MMGLQRYEKELDRLKAYSNFRELPDLMHVGKEVEAKGKKMLNLSSNDYLGVAGDRKLKEEFLSTLNPDNFCPSASSSRLLTGNFSVYHEVETLLSSIFRAEAALVFSSGYHMNTGILPALSDPHTLILADKLIHASLVDGIRLSNAKFLRYPHNDYKGLETLLHKYGNEFETIIIVTESIFSMDGDKSDLPYLVDLKKRYGNVLLYVDEAHGIGAYGKFGLGCAEESGCMEDIDILVGTFGKALASMGAYVVCKKIIRDYLVNKMRTLIFTTALPPVCMAWTKFVLERLPDFASRRKHLRENALLIRQAFLSAGYACPSHSHIIPLIVGESQEAVIKATEIQQKGFYVLPVRPPTVPEGTSRIRVSLTAALTSTEIQKFLQETGLKINK